MKKSVGVLFLITFLVLSAGFASAGWFSDTWNFLTGKVVSTNGLVYSSPERIYLNGQQYTDVSTEGLPYGTGAKTLCAFASTDSLASGWAWIFSFGSSSTGNAFFIGRNADDLYGGGFGSDIYVADFWKINQTKHICLTYENKNAKLYADGELVQSGSKTWNTIKKDARIGTQVGNSPFNQEMWKGIVSDIRVYSRALSASEVKELASASVPPIETCADSIEEFCDGYNYYNHYIDYESKTWGGCELVDEWFELVEENSPQCGYVVECLQISPLECEEGTVKECEEVIDSLDENGCPIYPRCSCVQSNITDSLCTDSDGGLNYYEKGITSFNRLGQSPMSNFSDRCVLADNYNYSQGGSFYPTDSCLGSNCYLSEQGCNSEGNLISQDYNCPNGCVDGACVHESNATCTDSDGGKNYFIKGETTGYTPGVNSVYTSKDMCLLDGLNNANIQETWCEGGEVKVETYNCPNGCVDGACVSVGCSVNAKACNLGYDTPLCGSTQSQKIWTGYEFELKEVCLTPTEPGISASWRLDGPSCAIVSVCNGACLGGVCVSSNQISEFRMSGETPVTLFKEGISGNEYTIKIDAVSTNKDIIVGSVKNSDGEEVPFNLSSVYYAKFEFPGSDFSFKFLPANMTSEGLLFSSNYYACSNPLVMSEGEVYHLSDGIGNYYESFVNTVATEQTQITLNGENSDMLKEHGSYTFSQGGKFVVKDIMYSARESTLSKVEVCLPQEFSVINSGTDITAQSVVSLVSGQCGGTMWKENMGFNYNAQCPADASKILSDGNLISMYGLSGGYDGNPLILNFNFTQPQKVSSFKLYLMPGPNNAVPGDYYMSYWDGSKWLSPVEISSNRGTTNQELNQWQEFNLAKAVETSAIRFTRQSTYGSGVGLAEFQILYTPEICVPKWSESIEPILCPASGVQKKILKDLNGCEPTVEKIISCNVGECSGCNVNGKCYPIGYRLSDSYCDFDGLMELKEENAECSNNFECSTNLCVDSECVSSSLWQKIVSFFKAIFGLN